MLLHDKFSPKGTGQYSGGVSVGVKTKAKNSIGNSSALNGLIPSINS
jgi:hypothetical protein